LWRELSLSFIIIISPPKQSSLELLSYSAEIVLSSLLFEKIKLLEGLKSVDGKDEIISG